MSGTRLDQDQYRQVVQRVHDAIALHTPPDAIVAVISKGDGNLVDLQARSGWHFPRNDAGAWAGYHPATSDDAVAHLEEQRAQGATFLAVPASAFWWLDHYDGFAAYLRERCQEIANDESCRVFELTESHVHTSEPATAVNDEIEVAWAKSAYARRLVGLQEIVDVTVPTTATVAVVSRGDEDLLHFEPRTAWHFPADARGIYAGHPADSADAWRLLQTTRRRGATYLLIPAEARWWRLHYAEFWLQLEERCRRVVHQRHFGDVFELAALPTHPSSATRGETEPTH